MARGFFTTSFRLLGLRQLSGEIIKLQRDKYECICMVPQRCDSLWAGVMGPFACCLSSSFYNLASFHQLNKRVTILT